MNIYYFYDTKTEYLVNNYFLPSLKKYNPALNPMGKRLINIDESDFCSLGFRHIITDKVEKVIKIIESETNPFLVSDIDIEFFGSIKPYLENISSDTDMVFQAEANNEVNTGFIWIKPGTNVLSFWEKILARLNSFDKTKFINEQILINKHIVSSNIKFSTFPNNIWNWTLSKNPPKKIVLHHANCTRNIYDKIKKLNDVRYKQHQQQSTIQPRKQYRPQIIVSRYQENLDWIFDYDLQDRCIIYNKGSDNLSPKLKIIKRPNYPKYGRETETYLYHILTNYSQLSDYIIFTQADPFYHSPHFCDIINHLDTYGYYNNFQPLSCRINDINLPCPDIINYDKSLYIDNKYPIYLDLLNDNLEPVMYIDHGWYPIEKSFRDFYDLGYRTKVNPILYDLYIKFNLLSKKPYIGFVKWNYGTICGINKANILQHDKAFYQNLYSFSLKFPSSAYILERMWYTIFS